MNDRPSALFTVSYRMERGDFVALTRALTRLEPRPTLAKLVVYFALLLLAAYLAAGTFDAFVASLAAAFSFPAVLLNAPLVVIPPLLLLLSPQLAGLVAASTYRRNAIADRDVTVHLTAEGIEGGATDLYSRVGWAAVTRLIETPKHLFIQISRREALIVPRRAVPNEDTYNNLKGFIRARTGLATH